eukprot:1146218-Pelagomonas_calceolata.AAC.10
MMQQKPGMILAHDLMPIAKNFPTPEMRTDTLEAISRTLAALGFQWCIIDMHAHTDTPAAQPPAPPAAGAAQPCACLGRPDLAAAAARAHGGPPAHLAAGRPSEALPSARHSQLSKFIKITIADPSECRGSPCIPPGHGPLQANKQTTAWRRRKGTRKGGVPLSNSAQPPPLLDKKSPGQQEHTPSWGTGQCQPQSCAAPYPPTLLAALDEAPG